MAQTIEATHGQTAYSDPVGGGAARSRAEAFGRAERHSRRVRRLKVVLPAVAVLMVVSFAGFSIISTPAVVAVSTEGTDLSEGKLVMANPKLEGFTKDGRPYSMVAGRAVQDFEQQGLVNLEDIDAKMPVENDNWARVQTKNGVFNRNDNTLDVKTDITVTTTDGMVAKLKSAFLDINNGNLKTSDAVDIQANGSTITAESMAILENGRRIIFETHVRMNIDPVRAKAAQAARRGIDASN